MKLIDNLVVSTWKKIAFFIHLKFDYEVINVCV